MDTTEMYRLEGRQKRMFQEIEVEELLKEHKEALRNGQISTLDFYVGLGVFTWKEIDELDKRLYSLEGE